MSADGYVSPWWQAMLLPDRWDLCGIEVRAMSVWHTFALENLGNAYIYGGVCDKDAASSLIMFCQRDWMEGRALFLRPVYRARALRGIYKTVSRMTFPNLDAAIRVYVQACNRTPDHKHPEDGSGKSGAAPYQWHVVSVLCSRYGMSEAQAWNCPYARARCLYDTFQETRGDDSLADDRLQRSIDRQAGERGEES